MERAAFALRILLIATALGLWLPGSLWAMDAGVVRIESQVGGKTRFGSGFVVRTEGDTAYLVTAAHVVEGDPEPKVYFHTRPHRPATARVLALEGGDPRGLALLLIDSGLPMGVEALPIAEGAGLNLRRGEPVTALGIPAGLRTWAVVPGNLVARKNRSLLFSGRIDEGNSGGPLVEGQAVVGLVMGLERGFGMAVPAMSLKIFLESNEVAWAAGSQPLTRTVKAATKGKRDLTLDPKALPAGKTFRDCDQCPEMVIVPAGSFEMGSPENEKGRQSNEGPVHGVGFGRPFAIAKQEVTFAQWDACVRDGGCGHKPDDEGWGRDQRPAINVNWGDASEYVQWLSKKTGESYRLPSEAEWEYAARAGTTRARFWGDDADAACAYANVYDETSKQENNYGWTHHACDDGHAMTAPVGSFEANGFGLKDMLGNVWEWTQDCWNDSYTGAPGGGSAWTEGDCDRRVLRGGSWGDGPDGVRSANRDWYYTVNRDDDVGFRPARTL